jgi:homoserine kinase
VERVTAFAPGSASNLGPGFDCLGIAFLGKGDSVTASPSAAPGVRVLSISDTRIPTDPDRNTAALGARAVLRRIAASGSPSPLAPAGLDLVIEKGLPLAAGLGGSAASAVAGAVAANAILRARLSPTDLLACALEAEAVVAGGRHADNVAPSLMGGAVLVGGLEADTPTVFKITVKQGLSLVLVTPGYQVETARARAVLPHAVTRVDAVTQASRLAGLVLGLERGDQDLIRQNMFDAIAEPARSEMFPGYPEARAAGLAAGALGVAVSGAGPTVVAVVPMPSAAPVAEAMESAYRRLGIEATGYPAQIDRTGARIIP